MPFPYIFTFYSYKGGVGRSMAVMNVAYRLAGWGRHVLIVDMDLEAPGISGFLERNQELEERETAGDVVSLLSNVLAAVRQSRAVDDIVGSLPPISDFARVVNEEKLAPLRPKFGTIGRLDVLGPQLEDGYFARLAELGLHGVSREELITLSRVLRRYFKAQTFLHRPLGVELFEDALVTHYDYVIVDSRTGITEIGGLCVGPLADRLVVVTGLNDQNVDGTLRFLREVGIEPRQQTNEPWDDADQAAMQDGVERHNLGPKPTVIVASPVPISEINLKQQRLNELEKRLGIKPLTLSYHPQLALMESIFVRDYPAEYPAGEHARLSAVLMAEVADEARQLAMDVAVKWNEKKDWAGGVAGALRMAPQAPEIGFSLLGQLFRAKPETSELPLQRRLSAVLAEDTGNRRAALNNWGNGLADEARASGPKADLFFQAAYRRYQEARKLDSNYFPALINWGSALSDQAKSKSGPEADSLFTEALDIYEEARRPKRDEHVALNNSAAALHDWAKTKSGVEAKQLSAKAAEKYAEAVRRNPDDPRSFYNWGNLLSDEAVLVSRDEARRLYADAAQKYAQAYQLDTSYRWIFNNWGNALYKRAKLEDRATADRLFAEATTKFREALEAFPDFAEAANNWGAALSEQAHTKSGEEALHCLQQACAHFEDAVRLNPHFVEARTNWADALTRQSRLMAGETAVQVAHAAVENVEIAAKQKPNDGAALNIWGNALTQLARLEPDRQLTLFEEATSKYAQAIALNPSDAEAYYNWGTAFLDLAKIPDVDVEAHINQAIEKFAEAVRLKPGFYEALNNWGAALIHRAGVKTPPESEALLDEAFSKLMRAEELSPGSGAFNLACVEARRGNPAGAVRWLEALRSLGRPATRDQLFAESDLEGIRQSPEFTEFLESAA